MGQLKHILILPLVACVPMAAGPPPTQIPIGFDQEFGSTFGTGAQVENQEIEQLLLDESLWYRKRIGDKSEFQLVGGAAWNGDPIFYGAIGLRRYLMTADGGKFGLDIKFGGPYYAEIGLPLQRQLGDKPIWLTTHPSVGLNAFGAVHIPVGLNWQPKDKWLFNTSLGTRWRWRRRDRRHPQGRVQCRTI